MFRPESVHAWMRSNNTGHTPGESVVGCSIKDSSIRLCECGFVQLCSTSQVSRMDGGRLLQSIALPTQAGMRLFVPTSSPQRSRCDRGCAAHLFLPPTAWPVIRAHSTHHPCSAALVSVLAESDPIPDHLSSMYDHV